MLCWEMIRGPGLDCLIFMKFYVNGDCQVKWKKVCLLDICNSMFPRVYCLFDFIEAEMFTLPGVVSNPPVLHVKLEDRRQPEPLWSLPEHKGEEWRQNMQNNAITGLWTLGTLYRDKHISPTAKTAAGSEGAQSSPSHSVFPPLEMLTGSQWAL